MNLIELTFDTFKEEMKVSNLIQDCIERTNIASITRVAIIILSDQLTSFDKKTLEEYNLVNESANKSTGAATNAVANGFPDNSISANASLDECRKIRNKCESQTIKELMNLLISSNIGAIKKQYESLKKYFEESMIEGEKVVINKEKVLKTHTSDSLKNSRQVVLTGAPGTGKTYLARKMAEEIISGKDSDRVVTDEDIKRRIKFVQFHSSYDYSDFVEGLRPVQVKESDNPTFVKLDGVFKAFCRTIVENEFKCIKEYLKKEVKQSLLVENNNNESQVKIKIDDDELLEIIADYEKHNRANTLDKFEYTSNEDSSDSSKVDAKNEIVKLLKENTRQEKEKYFFIIDEINRADLSKVLGELMFGLEESYRGIENRFETQYKNLKTYEICEDTGRAKPMVFDCFAKGFFIPENIYIIGTMNDIDRSVEAFDLALRRRFVWIEIDANENMESTFISMDEVDKGVRARILKNVKKMNEIITTDTELGLGKAYNIGAAYFKDFNGSNLIEIWDYKIEPILKEYCRGRNKKIVDTFLEKCKFELINVENKSE